MVATERIQNIYDVALKPRLLRSLLKEYVPDEKHPFRNPSDLSYVVSAVRTHRLLSESPPPSTDQNGIDTWKSAVDSWDNRLSALASNSMPDKCWAGVCLLGVTCQECSSERFLASYSAWFNKLVAHIQPPADSHIVKAASIASLSDLLTRLAGHPNEKKDGYSLATKLIQPVLKLLNEDSSEVVWEEAICLLCTIIDVFPSSIQRQYDNVEAAIVLKLMSGKCTDSLLKRFGHILALLPKSRGDAESWSTMMQKVLISIDTQLEVAFQGVEEESRRNETRKLLLPPGKEPPPPLGGQIVQGENPSNSMKRPELLLVSRISTLMGCCCELLTTPYPIQVPVPVRALVSLAERVLMVDGSSSHALYPSLSTMNLEMICSELPLMHMCSLELLYSTVQGLRSHLLPHMVHVIRLLTEYFERCKLPELRIKVYSIVKDLLLSMGLGVVVYLNQEIISSAHIDLDSFGSERGHLSSNVASVSAEALARPRQKKRKHAVTSGSLGDQSNRVGIDAEKTSNITTVSVKIAALEALEALLTVGGAFRSDDWRPNVDHLLANVASDTCKDGFVKEEEYSIHSGKTTFTWADLQLAALRAFLASLVSPGRIRPRYLAQGLELFRRGTCEGGTRVAKFCAHSLLTLEVLIHPRSLPLVDFESATDNYDGVKQRFPDSMYFIRHKQDFGYHPGMVGKGPGEPDSDHDDPLLSLLQSDDEMEIPETDLTTNHRPEKVSNLSLSSTGKHAEQASKIPLSGSCDSGSARHNDTILEVSETGAFSAGAAKRILIDGKEVMADFQQTNEPGKPSGDYCLEKGGIAAGVSGGDMTISSGTVKSGNGALGCISNDLEMTNNINVNKRHVQTPGLEESEAARSGKDEIDGKNESHSDRSKGITFELERQSSMDSIPDIVDGDPDSD